MLERHGALPYQAKISVIDVKLKYSDKDEQRPGFARDAPQRRVETGFGQNDPDVGERGFG